MKKILSIAVAFLMCATLTFAQDAKPKAKPVGTVQPKQIPLKAVSSSKAVSKQEPAEASPQNAAQKEAGVNAQPAKSNENTNVQQGKPVLKKDGTPDRRYKENQKLKKDGTPDKRYKENKEAGAKK
ncbi:MAG TPA: hypothetical protein PK323_07805 [Bacteroidia bacterium]|nr:hypothetical protein [Bacteroidia bacterium]